MKIEIWFDFTCPYCYIGKRNFELALERFENRNYVTIEFKSFQLDPNAKSNNCETVSMRLMRERGLTAEKINEMLHDINEQAKQVGLTICFDEMEHTNTFNAHRLTKFARKREKELDLVNRLFQKYFIDNQNIGRKDVLLSLAREMKFEEVEINELLSLNNYAKAVQADEELARELGVDDIPFFVFNEKHALSGVQSTEMFLNVLEQIWLEEESAFVNRNNQAPKCKTSYCEGKDCE